MGRGKEFHVTYQHCYPLKREWHNVKWKSSQRSSSIQCICSTDLELTMLLCHKQFISCFTQNTLCPPGFDLVDVPDYIVIRQVSYCTFVVRPNLQDTAHLAMACNSGHKIDNNCQSISITIIISSESISVKMCKYILKNYLRHIWWYEYSLSWNDIAFS